MRHWIFILIMVPLSNSFGLEDWVIGKLELGRNARGIFVSTNSSSGPFYLLDNDPNLPSRVGSTRIGPIIDSSRVLTMTQYVSIPEVVNGETVLSGYIQESGRYAVLSGRSLTLTGYDVRTSVDKGSVNEILSVHLHSVTYKVPEAFAEEASKLLVGRTPN